LSNIKSNAGQEKASSKISDKALYNIIYERFGLTKAQFLEFVSEKSEKFIVLEKSFPIIILKSRLSGLEAIVKYLRENRHSSYKQIGQLLCRNPKTLAVTYNISKRKMPEPYPSEIDETKDRIEYSAFQDNLSILESICSYLKWKGMNYSKIARLLGKNPRTVWTVCKRAEKKSMEKNDG
jgi:DNA-binding CsgD family transcriptional regulator